LRFADFVNFALVGILVKKLSQSVPHSFVRKITVVITLAEREQPYEITISLKSNSNMVVSGEAQLPPKGEND
tara:strand:- start:280 stop:495 length:216 start_codon:yes stop_codon:yes gene_type:complete